MIAFGTVEGIGNAVMRLEVDEVELISGNWTKTGFTIPVCGAHSRSINGALWAAHSAHLMLGQSAHAPDLLRSTALQALCALKGLLTFALAMQEMT